MAADQAPSLGEITSIKGDADLGWGGGAIVPVDNGAQELSYLKAAADTRAAANRYIYEQHQKNIQEALKNFNSTDVKGVFTPDYKEITDDYRNLAGDIYRNYDVLANPMKNPELYAQLMQRQASLNSKIEESKQSALIYKNYQDHLAAHPQFNTTQNLSNMAAFGNTPLGQRKIFNLTPPVVYNPEAIVKAAAEYAKQKTADVFKKNGYIYHKDTEQYDPKTFLNGVTEFLKGSNGEGGTYMDAINQQLADYNKNNPQSPLTTQQFIDKTFTPLIPAKSVTKNDMDADPFALSNLNFAHQKALEAIRLAGERENIFLRQAVDKKTTADKGDFINSETAKLFLEAQNSHKVNTIQPADGGAPIKEKVATLTPSQMKLFAIPVTPPNSLNGKPVLVTPDFATLTPSGNLRVVFYKRDDLNGTSPQAASKTGQRAVDQSLTQEYTPDEVRATIATHVSPSQYDDVMFEANKALEKATGAQRFDSTTIEQYAKAHGLHSGTTSQQPTKDAGETKTTTTVKASGTPPSVSSQKDYDALPSGTQYLAPDGKLYVKK